MNEKVLDQASETMQRDKLAIDRQSERILECYEDPRQPDQAENLRQQMGKKSPHDHLIQEAAREIVDRKLIALAREILQAVNSNKRTLLPDEIKDHIFRLTNVQL